MGAATKPNPATAQRRAKKVALDAITLAAEVASDLNQNRSTRTRAGYKLKADALDRVARILSGKE